MIESALRTHLLANTELKNLVTAVYVGDTPYSYSYPFIRLVSAGENPDDYGIKDRLIETVAVDIFASHNPQEGIFGYSTINNIAEKIREQFDAFIPIRWTDDTHSYDIIVAEYRGYAPRKNAEVNDVQKPITITFTYNII
jgi:hypothetical protein